MCKNANKFLGYWTTNYTPLLDTGKMKVLINSIHSSRAAILSFEVGVTDLWSIKSDLRRRCAVEISDCELTNSDFSVQMECSITGKVIELLIIISNNGRHNAMVA